MSEVTQEGVTGQVDDALAWHMRRRPDRRYGSTGACSTM